MLRTLSEALVRESSERTAQEVLNIKFRLHPCLDFSFSNNACSSSTVKLYDMTACERITQLLSVGIVEVFLNICFISKVSIV